MKVYTVCKNRATNIFTVDKIYKLYQDDRNELRVVGDNGHNYYICKADSYITDTSFKYYFIELYTVR